MILEEARLDESFRRRLDELDDRALSVARELIDARRNDADGPRPGGLYFWSPLPNR